MAENLRRHNKKKINVLNTGHAWPAAARFSSNQPSSSSVSSQRKPTVNPIQSPTPTPSPVVSSRPANTGSLVISGQRKSAINPIQPPGPPSVASSSSSGWKSTITGTNTNRISHSTSAPNLVDTGSVSDFPPVSTLQTRNGPATKNVEEVYAANKSMVERIRAGLGNDQEKYASFKDVSAQYRQGVIDAETYLVYVDEFGLSHLVVDLARLLPDPSKERELIAVYNANRTVSGPNNGLKRTDKNSKGKSVTGGENSSTSKLTNSILNTVRELQSNYRPPDEEVETLSKDGYRAVNKGKSKVEVDSGGGGDGDGRGKQQRKKTSKFLRARLGNGSMASILDLSNSNGGIGPDSEAAEATSNGNKDDSGDGVPVRGVWRNGGGHKLIVKDQKRP